jgi:cytochrome c biogenesis protein CcdA/thiol-disulfide isomerase/thioredoxin
VIAAFLIFLIVGVIFIYNVYINVQNAQVEKVPLFSSEDIDGNLINLADSEGKIVILDFVYFDDETCDHCRITNIDLFQTLEEIKDDYGDKVEIIVIDMTSDPSGDRVRALRDQYNIELPIINDYYPGSNTNRKFDETNIGGKYTKYWTRLGEFANPTILILDQELKVRYQYNVLINDAGRIFENKDYRVTPGLLKKNIDAGLENDWPSTVEGNYVSSEVKFLTMFIAGVFISITPCAMAIFVSMTTYVLSQRPLEDLPEEDDMDGRYIQVGKGKTSLVNKILMSNEFYGGLIGTAFTLGIGSVFFIMGCLITYLLSFVRENATIFHFFFIIIGLVLILIGINLLKNITLTIREFIDRFKTFDPDAPIKEGFFEKVRNRVMRITEKTVLGGAFLLGVIMALGWAPCILSYVLPIFLLVTSQEIHFLMGGAYMFTIALGFGLPIILVSSLSITLKGEISQHMIGIGKVVKIIFSIFVMLVGLYLIISNIFPEYSITRLLGL